MVEITKVEKVFERLISLLNIIVDDWTDEDKLKLYGYLIAEFMNKKTLIELKG